MPGRMRNAVVATASLAAAVVIGGCGHGGTDSGNGSFTLLEPQIQAMQQRLRSHYDSVAGAIASLEGSSAAQAGSSAASDWEAIDQERVHYGRDMQGMLDALGQTVTLVGSCRMMMGGMAFGSDDVGATCPCAPYMNTSLDEVETHLEGMRHWSDLQDPEGLLEEMDRHMDRMGADIHDMSTHMRQTYGSRMGGHGGMGGM